MASSSSHLDYCTIPGVLDTIISKLVKKDSSDVTAQNQEHYTTHVTRTREGERLGRHCTEPRALHNTCHTHTRESERLGRHYTEPRALHNTCHTHTRESERLGRHYTEPRALHNTCHTHQEGERLGRHCTEPRALHNTCHTHQGRLETRTSLHRTKSTTQHMSHAPGKVRDWDVTAQNQEHYATRTREGERLGRHYTEPSALQNTCHTHQGKTKSTTKHMSHTPGKVRDWDITAQNQEHYKTHVTHTRESGIRVI
ncbi:hypothetical protein J6590_071874 [Homalodisca vitripennis]|nr:hypothetical protein J6590_071874 [Homalodisca vitripennis]